MEINVTNGNKLKVAESVFAVDFNEGMVHQVVTSYMHTGRQGTKAQKTRSEVRGGGAKPWRQKGTGRARAGTSRSPIWRSGGVTFAAKPRKFKHKINKKVYKKAICCILSELLRQERIVIIEDKLLGESFKTKDFIKSLDKVVDNFSGVLLIDNELRKETYLSSRNLPGFEAISVNELNPYVLVRFEKILVTESGLKKIEELFS